MMKINLFVLTFLILLPAINAQEVEISKDTVSRKEKKEKYRYQSIDHYDQKFLLKIGTLGGARELSFFDDFLPLDIMAFEYKISKSLSIQGTYYFPFSERDEGAISGGLRYYLKKNQMANNLSGRYFGVEYLRTLGRFGNFLGEDGLISAQYGKQIKKSRFGFADFRVYSNYSLIGGTVNAGFNMIFGAGWGSIGKFSSSSPLSSSYKGNQEGFIITLENPFLSLDQRSSAATISSSFETTIFAGLTSRTEATFAFEKRGYKSNSYKFSVSQEVRKYFGNLKKPSFNRSIDSFAGFYAGLIMNDLYRSGGVLNLDPRISFGYQERVGGNHFFDVFLRYSLGSSSPSISENSYSNSIIQFGTRVGLNWGR